MYGRDVYKVVILVFINLYALIIFHVSITQTAAAFGTMLSEITDHQGTHVIPAMLYPAPQAIHLQHYHQNSSLFQWPYQHPPRPAVWNTWQQFISWMYLQLDSWHLQHPLGHWLPEYTLDYQWKWQICPRTHVLFHQENQQWWAYLPACWYPTHTSYRNQCSLTSTPAGTVPVTPIIFDKNTCSLTLFSPYHYHTTSTHHTSISHLLDHHSCTVGRFTLV